MSLCKHINKSQLNSVIETINIPVGYYITAECIEDVEKMVLSLWMKLLLRFFCMILNIFK